MTGIYSIEPEIRWKSLLELKIPNENLRKRVETFLNLFERSAFRYDFQEASSGRVEDRYLSGQDILGRLEAVREQIKAWKEKHKGSKIAEYLATTPVIQNGKFFVTQHNRDFNDGNLNGTQTMFVGNPIIGAYPLGFEIGTDYLRGAKYHGVDKKLHPVTVDAAVVHELAHMAYNTGSEDIPIMVEGIVVAALGGVQRDNVYHVDYAKNVNGGFWLLSHRAKSGGALSPEFEARVKFDFDGAGHPLGFNCAEAMMVGQVPPSLQQ